MSPAIGMDHWGGGGGEGTGHFLRDSKEPVAKTIRSSNICLPDRRFSPDKVNLRADFLYFAE